MVINEKKSILVIASGWFHPPCFAVYKLRRIMDNAEFNFKFVSTMEALWHQNLDHVHAIILYFHRKNLSPRALQKFRGYVANGGGVLAIHSATASFKDIPAYAEVIGGKFIGHNKVNDYRVDPTPGRSELFAGIPGFNIRDELYLHQLNPEITVHYETQLRGISIPVVWTYQFCKGKVCYASPGHLTSTLENPIFQQVLNRGLQWVSS